MINQKCVDGNKEITSYLLKMHAFGERKEFQRLPITLG